MSTAVTQSEINMYGCARSEIRAMVEESIYAKMPGFNAVSMILMGMMSDAQEEISHGMSNQARQTLNRAKWIINNMVTGKPI